jgi:uncharacterized protein YndB with AHSA1/START domain
VTEERDRTVRLERLLPARVEDVFAAWTEPERMTQWLAPVGRAEVEADVVVGGHLRVVMTDGEVRIEHDGEYLEVHPPTRSRSRGGRDTRVTGPASSPWS